MTFSALARHRAPPPPRAAPLWRCGTFPVAPSGDIDPATSRLFIVSSTETSTLLSSAPTSQDIARALALVPDPAHPEAGGWIGPAPRVTRVEQTLSVSGYLTTFAWLYAIPNASFTSASVAALRTRVAQQLFVQSPDWNTPTITAYSPTLNGNLAFWQCTPPGGPCASQTHTRDDWAAFSTLQSPENPVGPDSPAVHPVGVFSPAGALGGTVAALETVAVVGAVVVAGVYLGPLALAWLRLRR